MRPTLGLLALIVTVACAARPAAADPWIAPGDSALRSDLYTLGDAGVLRGPLTAWPLPWGDIAAALEPAPPSDLGPAAVAAYERVRARARNAVGRGQRTLHTRAALAERPRVIRSFEGTPREEGELSAGLTWAGDRFAVRLNATRAWHPADGDDIRLDGSYVGAAVGNWMLSVGYPERWWGPGWDGSLILSTNARPTPQIAIDRSSARPFEARWLRWLGPWTLSSFFGALDDERERDNALLFGLRVASKPLPRLEIGLSRTAQWCGDGRPCSGEAFWNLMIGRSNRGVNIPEEDEPGNQLAGFDLRWAPPFRRAPAAVYMQWIGEDSRQGGPQIGSWLRQVGLELTGTAGPRWQHRTFLEVSETICREGGIGFSDEQFNCAYDHPLYQPGYRYESRSLAHGIDGDGRAYAVGTMLSGGEQRSWQASLRHADVNRGGPPNPSHTLSPTPQEVSEIAVIHRRALRIGGLRVGLGYRRLEDRVDATRNDRSLTGWLELIVD